MITKDQFIGSLNHELTVIQHLATKLTPEMLEYRPSPAQRSTLELMQYLGHIFTTCITLNLNGSSAGYPELFAVGATVNFENFQEKIEAQKADIAARIGALTDEELAEVYEMFGATFPRAVHLLGVMNIASAYKMQLFLYIKANGVTTIGTANLWGGYDMPAKDPVTV